MKFSNLLAAAMLSTLAACGGGGGGSSTDPSGRVSITATGPTTPVGSGNPVQFDVVVSNTTTAPVSNVVATLSLGSGLTRTGVICTASGGAVCPADSTSMSVASLPASASLRFQVSAAMAAGTRGSISSTASVSVDGAPASSSDQVPLAVQAFVADVQVTAQAPTATLTSGGLATYTMTVTNAGPDASSNLTLENTVDPHQTLGTITCAAQGGATCPATLGALMTVPTLPVGATLVFTVPATIASNTIGAISNTMYAAPGGDPVSSNNVATASASTAIDANGNTSFITLQSDAGDYVGAGLSYAYSTANAQLTVSSTGGQFHLGINGNDNWSGDFAEPSALALLQPGTYQNLTRFAFMNPAVGGIDWSGDSRGCGTQAGSFTIDKATYSGTTLTAIDLRFEQHCEGAGPALRGQIHWLASDHSLPPGPVTPVPATLWSAPTGATPASGNYVYLQSDVGDYIGGGLTNVYTQANAVLTTAVSGTHLSVGVTGNDNWSGDFQGMNSLTQLQPGYYAGLERYPFNNPVTGGLSWDGDGAGCNTLTGWFAIDSITYTAGTLTAVDLRFEQHCEGVAAALHGQIHWVAGDTTVPAGPQNPPPSGLWRAAAGATPASGNYVYLQSDSGDYIGAGGTYLYTQADATLALVTSGAHLGLGVTGNDNWTADFQGMDSISQLQPGYYGGLRRYPFNNPATGGLDWGGDGRGCNTLTGWFVIDSVTYSAGTLASVDLRFEQHCEGGTSALHGQVHWVAGDTTAPPGPQSPAPAGLWTPPAGIAPASGNYVYLQSDAGDYVGGGATTLYTDATSTIQANGSGTLASVYVTAGTYDGWSGDFQGMDSITQLQPGYYANLQRYPFNNPATGGLSWSGNGAGCNTLTGWFVVDGVSYNAGALASLDLRFEQHCEGATAALHGKIHWAASSSTTQ